MSTASDLADFLYSGECGMKNLEDAATELRRLEVEALEYQQAADTMAAAHKVERDQLARDKDELLALLTRYYNETPLGHQPHMIAHLAETALKKHGGEA